MSTAPLARSSDLRRLLDDGYDVAIEGGHLVVSKIPYVTADGAVAYGFLAYPVTVSGDEIVSETDHRIWFGPTLPHKKAGVPLCLANPERREISGDLRADFMLSSKPAAGYANQYEKVTAYVRILTHPAQAVDSTVTATPGAAWQEVEDDLPFVYRDTATTRAGLSHLTRLFCQERVAIIGLGGSGGYILDQVAKTPVEDILLIDGDVFGNHNAFRAPWAASLEELRERPPKVEYFAAGYSRMHTGIRTEFACVDGSNLGLLDGSTFVFLAIDDAEVKAMIAAYLTERGIAFIDVGMGVEEIDGRLSGLLRTVFVPAGATVEEALVRVPKVRGERDEYDRNIQTADLNALNGVLAVLRWKRHLRFYADGAEETFSTYSIFTNEIGNEIAGSTSGFPTAAAGSSNGATDSIVDGSAAAVDEQPGEQRAGAA